MWRARPRQLGIRADDRIKATTLAEWPLSIRVHDDILT